MGEDQLVLLCRVSDRLCALPLIDVIETMRPQPVSAMNGTQSFVLGVSVVRGEPVPVVDVRRLLGSDSTMDPQRLVTVRLGKRSVALAVDEVVGVRALDVVHMDPLPPLLAHAGADVVEALGQLDQRLLVVLRASKTLTPEAWKAIDARTAA